MPSGMTDIDNKSVYPIFKGMQMAKTVIVKKEKEKERVDSGLILGLVAVGLVTAVLILGPKLSGLIEIVQKVMASIAG